VNLATKARVVEVKKKDADYKSLRVKKSKEGMLFIANANVSFNAVKQREN
jgi:hypothetical protein